MFVTGPDPDAYADLLNPAPEASAQQGTAAAIELDRDSAAKQYRSFELVMESIAKKHEAREKARQTQTTRCVNPRMQVTAYLRTHM